MNITGFGVSFHTNLLGTVGSHLVRISDGICCGMYHRADRILQREEHCSVSAEEGKSIFVETFLGLSHVTPPTSPLGINRPFSHSFLDSYSVPAVDELTNVENVEVPRRYGW